MLCVIDLYGPLQPALGLTFYTKQPRVQDSEDRLYIMQFVYFNILVRALALFAVGTFSSFAQSWVQINVTGTPPAGRFNDTAVYDASSERLIVFGGFNSAT